MGRQLGEKQKGIFLHDSPIKREKTGTLLKVAVLYPAREDAWAQKIFAAASLRGRGEKAW